jgi:ABC-2 type transport system ATP-binding protein
MIEVAHLARRFGSILAVDDLSFSLEKGEVVGFLGPNGAGKTTTMRILTGYLPATSAEQLTVAGFDVLRQSMEVRRRIGYLPESVPLYREMRVREMMQFQGRLHRMDRGALRRRVPEVLERVGVLDRESQLVGNLSRGLRQRVGLAVALLADPEVLILDEPTSGLDPLQRAEVRTLIRDLASEHTVLLSSHILAEIESICPRVIILREGRLAADGTREDLVASLGGAGHVAFEAVVGDAAEAQRLLESLPGVSGVDVGERLGIHQGFAIHGEGDLREDVGALAMTQSWAVRELSWQRPSLEELFARLVLGTGELAAPGSTPAPAIQPTPAAAPPTHAGLELAPEGDASGDPPLGTVGNKEVFYSLNPFDQGGARDLTRPMKSSGDASEEPEGDCEEASS